MRVKTLTKKDLEFNKKSLFESAQTIKLSILDMSQIKNIKELKLEKGEGNSWRIMIKNKYGFPCKFSGSYSSKKKAKQVLKRIKKHQVD
ncbi:MAG: hypothetical protein OXF49_01375 [Candidatus Saccharibacteria bacterium]|nr:hypothetical protein [Candidatus Saccharibacteria bacterium]